MGYGKTGKELKTHAITTEPLAEEQTVANRVAQVHGEV